MNRYVQYTAVVTAVVTFFLVALLAWLAKAGPDVMAARAIKGALVAYIVSFIASRIVLQILISQVATDEFEKENQKDNPE